jgi:hypothetical protein
MPDGTFTQLRGMLRSLTHYFSGMKRMLKEEQDAFEVSACVLS